MHCAKARRCCVQEKKKKELEELEATLAEFGIEGAAGAGDVKSSAAVRIHYSRA